jgi:hypothetical protein
MEVQHRDLMRAARNGAFAKGELKPFGHGIVTNRSFDEIVAEFLAAEPALLQAAARAVAAAAGPEPEPEPEESCAAAAAPAAARRRRSAKRT